MFFFVSKIAFFVGGATMLGALLGFVIKKESKAFNAGMLSAAAGIMYAAATMELIAPAVMRETGESFLLVLLSLMFGAVFIRSLERCARAFRVVLPSRLKNKVNAGGSAKIKRVLLFVLAIAIHNFPEGLAAGVSCGMDERAKAFAVALGIAIQNLPEGMVLIQPMLHAGLSKKRTLLLAFATGWIEIAGAYLGWGLVSIPFSVLTYLLPFAGGTMLYIVNAELIPEAIEESDPRIFSKVFFLGFCSMLFLDRIFGA